MAAPEDSLDPLAWLREMAQAFQQNDYHGRFYYFNGRQIRTLRIVHRVNAEGVEQERLLHLSGEPAEVIRNGDQIVCYHPNNSTTSMQQKVPSNPFAHGLPAHLENALEHYKLEMAGMDRVANRDAVRIHLMPRDASRYGFLLWLDKQTALLLKSMLVNQDGEPLEVFEFVHLETDIEIPDAWLQPSQPQQNRRRLTLNPTQDASAPTDQQQNWEVSWLPRGFVRSEHDLRRVGKGSDARTQIYTDGVSAFSVFVEQMNPPSQPVPSATRQGATIAVTRMVTRQDNGDPEHFRVTLVGEVPLATGEQVVESFRWR